MKNYAGAEKSQLQDAIDKEKNISKLLKKAIKEDKLKILQLETKIAKIEIATNPFNIGSRLNYIWCCLKLITRGVPYTKEIDHTAKSALEFKISNRKDSIATHKEKLKDIRIEQLMFPSMATEPAKNRFIVAMNRESNSPILKQLSPKKSEEHNTVGQKNNHITADGLKILKISKPSQGSHSVVSNEQEAKHTTTIQSLGGKE